MRQVAGVRSSLADAASAHDLLNVVYCSKAVRPLAGTDLQGLVQSAQARNKAESITGLVLYDDTQFYQWLEGPADSLGRVMRSINADARHTAIRVLANRVVDRRTFRGWALQLASADRLDVPDGVRVLRPSRDTIDRLRHHPDDAPELLAFLGGSSRTAIQAVVSTLVLPRLLDTVRRQLGATDRQAEATSVKELADLLLAGQLDLARTLIDQADPSGLGPASLFGSLIEPAARHMGDLWSDDLCSEFDLTLALCALRAMVRGICGASSHVPPSRLDLTKVLIAAHPRNAHTLAGVLEGEVLWQRGWLPRIEFPRDEAELCHMLAVEGFDCLILGLSAVTAQAPDWSVVRNTIAAARRTSCNAALGVVVSGRAAATQPDFAHHVGADAGSDSASGIIEAIHRSRQHSIGAESLQPA